MKVREARSRRYDYPYTMGMGYETKGWSEEWLGGEVYVTEDVSEQNQRTYYERWAELMENPPTAPQLRDTAPAAE